MNHPAYEIRTLDDMLAIPADRIDAFLEDLKLHLLTTRELAENATQLARDAGLPVRVRPAGFTWRDDGEARIGTPNIECSR